MQPLVIATGNPHKVSELRAIFAGAGISVVGLKDVPGHERFREPLEDGTTFIENVRIKAKSYAGQTGRICLADDSGIEIDALGGRPGVISSHFCTDGREAGMSRADRDAANIARALRELEGVQADKRAARFVCHMCVADPKEKILAESRGTLEGRIGIPPRVPSGANGFGYDPIFLVGPDFLRTGAELPTEEKNRLSHRARAAQLIATCVLEAPDLIRNCGLG